jgi:hypothetical protein
MPKPKSNNVRINLMFPPKLLNDMKKLAARRGTTYTALITTACRDHMVIEKEKEKILRS